MGSVTKALEKAVNSMELEKITEVMDKFEKTFEDLDVHTGVMEGAMGAATATSTPANQVIEQFGGRWLLATMKKKNCVFCILPIPAKSLLNLSHQVDDLIRQVAEENGLEVASALPSAASATLGEATATSSTVQVPVVILATTNTSSI